jgi:hypothetical protein
MVGVRLERLLCGTPRVRSADVVCVEQSSYLVSPLLQGLPGLDTCRHLKQPHPIPSPLPCTANTLLPTHQQTLYPLRNKYLNSAEARSCARGRCKRQRMMVLHTRRQTAPYIFPCFIGGSAVLMAAFETELTASSRAAFLIVYDDAKQVEDVWMDSEGGTCGAPPHTSHTWLR